jgi:uncharacterized damage-inducible protein DinB
MGYGRGVTGKTPRGDLRPPEVMADEKTTLLTFLDYLRDAVVEKLVGVTDEDARRPLVASGTSLLWLVKHLTAVESAWFLYSYAGEAGPEPDESVTEADTVDAVVAAYRSMVKRCNEVIAAAGDLDRPGVRSARETPPPNMRWILAHMVEETARHAGHADIIREQLDGSVGR